MQNKYGPILSVEQKTIFGNVNLASSRDYIIMVLLGTFRSEDEDDYEYEFSVLSMRIMFGGRYFSKCACSEQKTRTRSRSRPPI